MNLNAKIPQTGTRESLSVTCRVHGLTVHHTDPQLRQQMQTKPNTHSGSKKKTVDKLQIEGNVLTLNFLNL